MRFFCAAAIAVFFISTGACRKKPQVQEVRYVAASDGLRLRATPDLKGEKITTIGNGAKVKVIEQGAIVEIDGLKSNWYRIEFAGKQGWVFGGYLTQPTNQPEAASEKFMGLWRGKHECKGDHTRLVVHPDKQFSGWLFAGTLAACNGQEIQGTWALDSGSICFTVTTAEKAEKSEKSCYDLEKGTLISNEAKGASFKENSEPVTGLKR